MDSRIFFVFFAIFATCIFEVTHASDEFVKVISFDGMKPYFTSNKSQVSECYNKVGEYYEDLITLFICQLNAMFKKITDDFKFDYTYANHARNAVTELLKVGSEIEKYQKKLSDAFKGLDHDKIDDFAKDVQTKIQSSYNKHQDYMKKTTAIKHRPYAEKFKAHVEDIKKVLLVKIKKRFSELRKCLESK